MITESFDNMSDAIICPPRQEKTIKCDVVIASFSGEIESYVVKKFNATKICELPYINAPAPIFVLDYQGKRFGFYKTPVGAPPSVIMLEDVANIFDCDKFLVFGSAGTLDKTCHRKVVVPTYAYRDEGTSYHYAKAEDYIEIKNHKTVSDFMAKYNIPFKEGKTWTTDAVYRETNNNFLKMQQAGCISVDMECSAMQAVCNYRNLNLYYFFLSGDLLDAPEWDKNGLKEANHNLQNFDIALRLACEL